MTEQARAQPDSEKDQYPPDADFGRQAARDEERVRGAARGREGADVPEDGEGVASPDRPPGAGGPGPRAAGKAEPATRESRPTGSEEGAGEVDDAGGDSFPASDPPSSTGSIAGG